MLAVTALCVGQWIWGVHAALVVLAFALSLPSFWRYFARVVVGTARRSAAPTPLSNRG